MTKEVILSLQGLQFHEAENEDKMETITKAEYYSRNNYHYLIFEEVLEGFDKPSKNFVKFNEHELVLNRRGLTDVTMVFLKDKKNICDYRTPFGNLSLAIDTRSIELDNTDCQITLQIKYALSINYEHFAECNMRMVITPRELS